MITEDGSQTLYLPELDEHYHSIHGAIGESLHIYIEQGLRYAGKKTLSILEIGFGTGLNAYLSFCYGQTEHINIEYCSLEKYPLTRQEYELLNYPKIIFTQYSHVFTSLHEAEWDKEVKISDNFQLKKIQTDLLTYQFDEFSKFDLVYYDAFAPGKQPEMWTEDILHKVAATVKKEGVIVTYCAKGTVRRTLAESGFIMERIPGPKGKKEILRGKKNL